MTVAQMFLSPHGAHPQKGTEQWFGGPPGTRQPWRGLGAPACGAPFSCHGPPTLLHSTVPLITCQPGDSSPWAAANYSRTDIAQAVHMFTQFGESLLIFQKCGQLLIFRTRVGWPGRKDSLGTCLRIEQEAQRCAFMPPLPWTSLDKTTPSTQGKFLKALSNLQIDGYVSASGASAYRGFKLSQQVNNKSYIIFINIHHSNCLNLHQNKVTL